MSGLRFVTAEEFAAVDEPGADALLGTEHAALIPVGGDIMFYGDGGTSKTTLSLDLACHLAAGDDWIGIEIPSAVTVGIIENEGPRAMYRAKVRRKLESWTGSLIGERLYVYEQPWQEFSFADPVRAERLAAWVADAGVDVLIAGPLTRVGMDELGTLQEVRDFAGLVESVRKRSGRQVAIILVHHENKGGKVSGAWEGAGDTLLHCQVHAPGETILHVQKARWSPEHHKQTYELTWTPGESFAIREHEERDLAFEIERLLAERPHRTAKEIAAKSEAGGIGANVDAVRLTLEANPERFVSRTSQPAKEVGRHPSAIVWECRKVTQTPRVTPSHLTLQGVGTGPGDSGDFPVRESPGHESPTPRASKVTSPPESPPSLPSTTEVEQIAAEAGLEVVERPER